MQPVVKTRLGWHIGTMVTGVTGDSRKVQPGGIFVAIPGQVADGHRYIADAVARGAVAVVGEAACPDVSVPYIQVPSSRVAMAELADTFWGHPSQHLSVVGVTGTNGKTSVVYWLTYLLRQAGHPTGMLSSVVNETGGEPATAILTTPESSELQAYLAEMRDRGLTHAVVEVSSHGIVQKRVHGIRFQMAILTNITREHLDFHQTMENYVEAKAELFRGLSAHSLGAILNRDDPWMSTVRTKVSAPISYYGFGEGDVTAKILHATPWSSELQVAYGATTFHTVLQHPGRYNVSNLLAVLAAAYRLQVPAEVAAAEIPHLPAVPGRMHVVHQGEGPMVVVDYAHTPNGLEHCLDTVKNFTPGKIWLVFGARGGRDRGKRPEMGKIAAQRADYVILTTDSPYDESPEEIARELADGVRAVDSKRLWAIELDRARAIENAVMKANRGDTVVITGRGPETTQQFGSEHHYLVDAEAAQRAVARRLGKGSMVSHGPEC